MSKSVLCQYIILMPKKIRELISMLEKAGFVNRGGSGSHRNFLHPSGAKITVSGQRGRDAFRYQEKAVNAVLSEVKK